MQARFKADQVRVTDRYSDFSRVVEHLRQAIAIWDGCRDMAKGDADFDPIRNEPAFVEMTED